MVRLLLPLVIGAILYVVLRPGKTKEFLKRASPAVLFCLGLLYLVSPVDFIPDVIPGGFIDDAALLLWLLWWLNRGRMQGPWTGRPHQDRAREAPGGTGTRPHPKPEEPWDPYRVLGVRRGASREEISRAYREQMKQYHPDRVAGLGEELQEVAHRKTIEIRRAYEELR